VIAPQYLLEFTVRSTLLAAGTSAVLFLLRVRAAAVRHGAWAGVVVLMMLLPLWIAWGPRASLRMLPAATTPVTAPMTPRAADQALSVAHAFSKAALLSVAAPARRPAFNWTACVTGIYLLGVSVLLLRLMVGTARAHLLVRRVAQRGGRLTSDACAAPITVGWLKPTVILPGCWRAWPQAQLDAVLAHEGEHARRRDPLVQWLALLNRAVFWFHPLAWWLERKLSALAEEACDAAVLARGHDPFAYSEYLLEIARSVLRTGARVKVLGMAMPGSFLPQRIRRILDGSPAQRISPARMVCVGLACAMVSAVFATGEVDRRMPAQRAEMPIAIVPMAPVKEAPTLLAEAQAVPARPVSEEPAAVAEAQEMYKGRRMVVLYFDLRAMPVPERSRAFAAAEQFIRTKMQSNDLLAIMAERGDVRVMQDFTADRNLLLQGIDRLMADPGPESSEAADVDRQLTSLHTAVQMLGSMDGKKMVVYFVTNVDRADSAEFQPLIDAAIRANVAFFPVELAAEQFQAVDKSYLIAEDDVLQIWVGQLQAVSARYTVRPDGMISVPMIGDVSAAGLTASQLEAVIGDRLEANGSAKRPSVTVGVGAVHNRIR
jgi:beta-lactamase regulating signal transducer with metallopeptidase domain